MHRLYKLGKSKAANLPWGSFNNYVDMICPFSDHLPTTIYVNMKMDKKGQKWTFLDHLPTSSFPLCYGTTPFE